MVSNAETLAQLERLAEARANARDGSDRNAATMLLSVAHDTNFGSILAAVRRWVKIEEAAKRFYWANRLEGEAKGAQLPRDRIIDAECATMSAVSELTAALKEPQ